MQEILLNWISWYFYEMPKNILLAWKNFLRFGLDYFSTPRLIKTLFSPWRKYSMTYAKGFSFSSYFETLFSNLIFRFLGAFFRTGLIIVGILFEAAILLVGFLVFLAWFMIPAFLFFGTYHGIRLLSL